MSYRQLSESEVRSMLDKYSFDAEVRGYAARVKKSYPTAVRFAIYTDSDYNDEYYINDRRVMAFSREGKTLGVLEIDMPRTDDYVESKVDRLYQMSEFDVSGLPALYVRDEEEEDITDDKESEESVATTAS